MNSLMNANNHAKKIYASLIPEREVAVQQFEALEGHITNFTSFGEDPLRSHPNLVAEREAKFHEQYPDFTEFFHTIVNGDSSLLYQ